MLLRRLAYWCRLYRLHPAIAAWIFIDRSPLTPAEIKRAQELLALHPEWNDPEWRRKQARR